MGAMRAVAALWLDAMLGVKFVHRVEPSTQSTHNRSAPIDNPKSPVIIPVISGWGMMIKAACIAILFWVWARVPSRSSRAKWTKTIQNARRWALLKILSNTRRAGCSWKIADRRSARPLWARKKASYNRREWLGM